MPKQMKEMMAEAVRTELDAAANLFVVGLLPMDSEVTAGFRNDLRGLGAHLRVIHNRTSRYALDEARSGLADLFRGPTALTLLRGEEPDTVGVARAIVDAAKKKRVEVRGGFVDGEILDAQGVELLSLSPDKHTLRGMLAGVILGPGRGIAASMNAVMTGIARCLQERIDKNGAQPTE